MSKGPKSTPEAVLETMKARFKPGKIKTPTTYYLSLGDADDHKWTVKLSPSACELIPGKIDKADCVLKTSADLFAKLVDGSWKPGVVDFMSGKIKTNDLDLLKNLQTAFGL